MYFNHRSSSFSVPSYRNSCLSYLLVDWKLSLDRGSVCLPAVTESPCFLNSEVLLLQQAWFTGVLSRHFRRVRRRQPSHSKTLFWWLLDFLTYWKAELNHMLATDWRVCLLIQFQQRIIFCFPAENGSVWEVEGDWGFSLCLTPVFLFICVKEEHEIYLTCLSNGMGILGEQKKNSFMFCNQ